MKNWETKQNSIPSQTYLALCTVRFKQDLVKYNSIGSTYSEVWIFCMTEEVDLTIANSDGIVIHSIHI